MIGPVILLPTKQARESLILFVCSLASEREVETKKQRGILSWAPILRSPICHFLYFLLGVAASYVQIHPLRLIYFILRFLLIPLIQIQIQIE